MINVGISVCLFVQTAKENFELALEVEKENADAMLWLARLHLYYNIPQACLRRYSCLLTSSFTLPTETALWTMLNLITLLLSSITFV